MSLLIILTFFSGCSLLKHPTYRAIPPVADLVEKVRESNGTIHSVRGIGRVEVFSRGKKFRTRQFLVLTKPDMMRIDLLDFRDLPYMSLAFQGETFEALDMRENVFYTGEVANGLSLFVPLRLTGVEFIEFIFGEMPDQDQVSARYDPHRRFYQLTFGPSNRWDSQTFWIHPKTLRVVEISKTDASTGDVIQISFDRFKGVGSKSFPREVKIEIPRDTGRIRFIFQKIEINPLLPRELFRLLVPPGVAVREIEDEITQRPLILMGEE